MTIAAVTDLDPIVAVLMASALLSLVAIRVVPFDPRLVVPFAADQITLDVPGSKGECEALLAAAVAGHDCRSRAARAIRPRDRAYVRDRGRRAMAPVASCVASR